MLRINSFCAALMVGLSSAAMAQATATETTVAIGPDGTPRYDVGSFDVAGIELGMTPDQVRAVMQEKGFSVAETAVPRHLTYAGLVQAQATRLNQPRPDVAFFAGPAEISGTDAGRNRLVVRFVQTRDGPRVSTIRLTFDRNTNDYDRLEVDLADRYGPPSSKMFASHGSHWCSIGGIATCDVSPDRGTPKLSYSPSITATLTLTNFEAMTAARDAEIAALFSAPTGERQRSLLGS
ncbi:MAG TPA: hypothetical protein DCX71_14195 [Erythrobacter sp.]|jgi:hypothetical protein|nr:hypothetical protein [Erythrobacter sp.]|tara:strand:+ start:237 stop:944 length:708 start_codon:yes stop_codon:yes gene_type:complete